MAEECVSLIPGVKHLVADKSYDTDAIRAFLKKRGIRPIIPGNSNRIKIIRIEKLSTRGAMLWKDAFSGLKTSDVSQREMKSLR
jgi:hypothetical protein